jgi:hypothetical protein
MSIITFSTLLAAGEVIHQFTAFGRTAYGFAIVFLVAGMARMMSARAFSKVQDPPLHVPAESKFTFWQFISRIRHSNFVRFVLFVSCMNFAVALSGPYFAVYMLRDLQLSYLEYTFIVSAAVVARLARGAQPVVLALFRESVVSGADSTLQRLFLGGIQSRRG